MSYSIHKKSEGCDRCEKPFEESQRLFSVIHLADEEPQRCDYCADCFAGRDPDPEREFAYWKTTMSAEDAPRRVVDFATLRELFFRMAGQESGRYIKLNYLLALVLIRKRHLKLVEFTSENGVDYLVVTAQQREEPLRLEAPELLSSEFEELREKLRLLLDLDLEEGEIEPESMLSRQQAAREASEAQSQGEDDAGSPPSDAESEREEEPAAG